MDSGRMSLVVTTPHRASIARAFCVHPIPWQSDTDQDRPMSEDRRQFGVTRVSQVGTFGPGLGWTVMHEKRCE
ncbi:hypothetical protein CH268_23590 [Rhodococcus sp. 06-1460-1B]|nr:hypothetical protein CH266_03980 [Rhodococcus sp. 06-1474-1B]OZD56035.1 hypothetical protein CH268_23590 [Rhodococcus sp. 06-1460-1B]